ncbi:MAG TPA: cyclic nucleotide-binding domain-containing protein [Actinomycetota bacterium]|nr:cyclic nucleotide-binding domain-containing protein [Actinomycetota bacterium]
MAKPTEILAGVPLFGGLSKRQLRRVFDLAEEAIYMEGHAVVREGQPGDSFFVLLAGQARVVGKSGRLIARLLPGDFFGEISLLDGGARIASVVSETPLTTLMIKRRPFVKLLESEPEIAMQMLKEVARRLRRAERRISG